jgi:hypothetical protein
MTKNIIQISPTYPPSLGGVGDYADLLDTHLLKKGIKSKFLISNFNDHNVNERQSFGNNSSDLSFLIEKSNLKDIILHYSPYGYATKGLCFHLIKCIKKWKKEKKERRLIIIFHELYAIGPVYKTSFWTYLPQKYLVKELFKLTDLAVVTTKKNQLFLSSIKPKKKVLLSNVFSTIGEIKNIKNLKKRKNVAIIFGGLPQKKLLYQDISINYKNYCIILEKLSISKIIDVGPKIKSLKKIGSIPIQSMGVKSRKFLSNLFRKSKAGLVFYPASQMTKSSIVAAYSSHGLVIINFCKEQILKTNEFISGVHFISDAISKQIRIYEKIVYNAYSVYKKNGVTKLVLLIENFLKKNNENSN